MPFAKFGRIFRKHMPYWVILSILLGLVFGYFLVKLFKGRWIKHHKAPFKIIFPIPEY